MHVLVQTRRRKKDIRLGYNHVIKRNWPAKVKMTLSNRSIEPTLRSINKRVPSSLWTDDSSYAWSIYWTLSVERGCRHHTLGLAPRRNWAQNYLKNEKEWNTGHFAFSTLRRIKRSLKTGYKLGRWFLVFSRSLNTGRVAKLVDAVAWRRLRVISIHNGCFFLCYIEITH